MQATRQQILDFLRQHGSAGVRDLGEFLELTPTGVRQHLTILEREGLVATREIRGRVGRPSLAYRLTPAAEALYPRSHDRLTGALLETLQRRLGEPETRAILAEAAEALARPHREQFAHASAADRLTAACEVLRAQDVVVDWERDGEGFVLSERTCPYAGIEGTHPSCCELDTAYLGALTGMHIDLLTSQARGDQACTFRVTTRPVRHVSG